MLNIVRASNFNIFPNVASLRTFVQIAEVKEKLPEISSDDSQRTIR